MEITFTTTNLNTSPELKEEINHIMESVHLEELTSATIPSRTDRLFRQCAVLLVSLLVLVAQIHAQTQATMNAQARAEFVRTDAELNRTYEALLTKLPDAESKQKLKQSQRAWLATEDSSAGLPKEYAKNYLIAASTISPDKKFAVIYPKFSEEVADTANTSKIKNYLVATQPFGILRTLETKWPYFQNESHGGLSAEWSDDSSVALVTLDGKWGPHDIFLVEFRDGKLRRMTNILAKAHDLLLPNYRKAKAERYNEYFDFIFESEDVPICELDSVKQVRIEGHATTDPKGPSPRKWSAQVKAIWDIPKAKFTQHKITRTTARESD